MSIGLFRLLMLLVVSPKILSIKPLQARTTIPSLPTLPEDGLLNFTQLSLKYGKQVQEHNVITEDGYILTIFNVFSENNRRGQPVLLMHGIADCSDTFIIRGNKSLVIALADAGYDVWTGNGRGNRYGRRHLLLDPDNDPDFWNFSLHEIGIYDIPATIDFILDATGHKTVNVIGQSQGNTVFWVLGSTRPEYNEKINVMIATAPVAFLDHLNPNLDKVVNAASLINQFLLILGEEELVGDYSVTKPFFQFICSQGIMGYYICANGLFFAFAGSDSYEFEPDFLPVVVGHYPQATSRKSLLHFAQIASSKRFAKFDYGPEKNLELYKAATAPNYALHKVTMRTVLFVGKNDGFSSVKDVKKLKRMLPNVVEYLVLKPLKWNHLDFVWGRNMRKYLFPYVFQALEKYNPGQNG